MRNAIAALMLGTLVAAAGIPALGSTQDSGYGPLPGPASYGRCGPHSRWIPPHRDRWGHWRHGYCRRY